MTSSVEIAKRLGRSRMAVMAFANKIGLRKAIGFIKERRQEYIDYIIAHYADTFSADIAEHLDISVRTVVRIARKHKLVKSEALMEAAREKTKRVLEVERYFGRCRPPKGTRIPKSELYQFKKGRNPFEGMTEEQIKARSELLREKRLKLIAEERRRDIYGLPRKSKIRIGHNHKLCHQRYMFKRNGYVLDEAKRIAYFTQDTKLIKFKAATKVYYKIRPIEERDR